MKRTQIAVLVAFSILLSAFFYTADVYAADWEVFSKISYLDWTEKTSLSKRDPFVRESGPVLSIGGSANFHPAEKIFFRSEAEIFGGLLNYQGEHLTNMSPYDTTGARLGATMEETLGYKFRIGKDFSLSPFATLGVSFFRREVCAENWYTGYGRIGILAEKGMFFARGGLFLPFYTEVQGSWQGVYWINGGKETRFEVQPQGVITPFAEIGMKYKRATVSFFYERKKWTESDRVNLGGGVSVFQPETTQDLYGVKVGFSF